MLQFNPSVICISMELSSGYFRAEAPLGHPGVKFAAKMFAHFVSRLLLLALDPARVKVALHHLDWFQRKPSNKRIIATLPVERHPGKSAWLSLGKRNQINLYPSCTIQLGFASCSTGCSENTRVFFR